jgi:oxalate decarboxylase/phosphoglucose isomerase-like protein (cupin superfamily)
MNRSIEEMTSIIELPKISDPRGNLTFAEGMRHVPFEIQRVYYLYDVPSGESRAGHAHFDLQQVIIALSGSFDLLLDNGHERKTVTCNRPNRGVYMSSLIWRELANFSSGAVCLVLASKPYEESDYIRDYASFVDEVKERTPR